MAMTFDRSMVKDFINQVDDHRAELVGAEFAAARIVGYIEQQRAAGALTDAQAEQLIDDAHLFMRAVQLGKRYIAMARNPPPEVRIIVLADEQREQLREERQRERHRERQHI